MKKRNCFFILLICYVAYTSIYIARLNLSMASPELIKEQILTTQNIGIMGSIFSIFFSFGRLLNGYFSDKTKPWVMISIGLLLTGISNIFIGFFPPYVYIIILWGINAYAQSMLWGCVLCIVSTLYNGEKAKKMTSIMVTSVATGNILGIILNTYIINHYSLNYAFVIPGGFSLICCILIILFTNKIDTVPVQKNHLTVKEMFKNKDIQQVLLPVMFHGVMKDNISLWMAVYFADTFLINLETSAYYMLLIPIVGFVGRLAFPLLYNLFDGNYFKVSMLGFGVCTVFSLSLIFKTIGPLWAVICLSIIYAAVSVINTSFLSVYPLRFSKSGNISSVSGIMDFVTYLGSGFSAFLYGIIIKYFSYSIMFLSWSIISIISVFLLFKIRKSEL